jgi:hypothetical protein
MFTKRSSYKIIEDGDSLPPESGATATPANLTFEDDDALLRNTEPPRSHEITSVSFEGGNNKYVDSSLHRSNSSNVRRWDHIEDVDHFFALIYKYYHGMNSLFNTSFQVDL